MGHWTLDDIAWDKLDRSKVDADVLAVVKAASLVEHNGRDYATYLCNVFGDDPEFQHVARAWALEEVQHGQARRPSVAGRRVLSGPSLPAAHG